MSVVVRFIKSFFPARSRSNSVRPDRVERYRAMLREEARIGGSLFGPLPFGVHREFFCLDEYTWIWHEEWHDDAGRHIVTTRYDVRPDGIVKSQGSRVAEPLSPEETRNFYYTVMAYCDRILPAQRMTSAA